MPAHSSSVAAPAEPCSPARADPAGGLRGLASATFSGLLLVGLLAGCGNGGGGNGAPSTSGGNTLSGTAATGAPIVAGTVTLKDSVGAIAGPIITDDFGNYSFGLGDIRFPLMLKVQPNVSGAVPLFSAALASGTANTTPLTTLQVFEAVGRTDPSEIYNSGDFTRLRKSSLDQAKSTVNSNLTAQYAANGLDFLTYDPITSPFVANRTGADAVLDQTTIAIIGNTLNLTDRQGGCIPYGGGLTLGIDGIDKGFILSFLGVNLPLNPSPVLTQYTQEALDSVCVAGTPVRIGPVTDGRSEFYYRVEWSGNPIIPDTIVAVNQLKGVFAPSSGSFCAPVLLNALSDAAFLAGSTA